MVWIKYRIGKEVYLGFKRGRLVRLGTKYWAADFELEEDVHENEIVAKYKEIISKELSPEEAGTLLNAKIIDVWQDHPRLDTENFEEIHYRWDAIKFINGKKVLYQRRGDNKVFDPVTNRLS